MTIQSDYLEAEYLIKAQQEQVSVLTQQLALARAKILQLEAQLAEETRTEHLDSDT